jgi:hypothetical protein
MCFLCETVLLHFVSFGEINYTCSWNNTICGECGKHITSHQRTPKHSPSIGPNSQQDVLDVSYTALTRSRDSIPLWQWCNYRWRIVYYISGNCYSTVFAVSFSQSKLVPVRYRDWLEVCYFPGIWIYPKFDFQKTDHGLIYSLLLT